jgi:hypothetical protein
MALSTALWENVNWVLGTMKPRILGLDTLLDPLNGHETEK